MVPGATNPEPPWHAQAREIFSAQMRRHCGLIDRIFAWLLIAQAVAAFAVAFFDSGIAGASAAGPLVVLVLIPAGLAWRQPGRLATRCLIAIAQMALGLSLAHVSRLQAQFHVFASLVLLGLYKDWRVLATAGVVALADRLAAPLFSSEGERSGAWLQEIGGLALMFALLVPWLLRRRQDGWDAALRQAKLDHEEALARETEETRLAERQAAQERLRQSEQELADFFENAPLALFWLGHGGTVLRVNQAGLGLLGYRPDEVTARSLGDFYLERRHWDTFLSRLRSGETVRNLEAKLRAKGGGVKDLLLDCNVLWEGGQFRHARCFVRDITERNKAQAALLAYARDVERAREQSEQHLALVERQAEELREARSRAEAANHAKGQFLANVSHEIRTPMNGILGMTALVLEMGLEAEQREYIELVQSSARNLLRVINDLLDFSKIEAGKLDLDPIPFELAAALDTATRPLALQARAKGVELTCHVDPDVPEWIRADPVRLNQVLTNLLGNALKFTSEGSIRLEVRAVTPAAGAIDSTGAPAGDTCELRFTVRDTGIGIPPEKHRLIFDPFTQADGSTTRKYGGTGLGLSISARLVEMMEGRIWVESAAGAGAAFHFTMRCLRAQPSRHRKLPAGAMPKTEAAGSLAPAAPLNQEALMKRVEGDVRLARDLALLFCGEIPRYRAQFDAAFTAKDAGRVHKIAHTLKGAVATFGARRAQELAAGLEEQSRAGDLEAAEATLSRMQEELSRLQQELETFVHASTGEPDSPAPAPVE